MRILRKYWAVLMLTCLALGLAGTEKAKAHGGTVVSFQTFYDELTPYGRWINYPGYGYVWAPDVEAGFQPYATRGHWVMTEYGNTWVSDYAWGWAPFHYGRWLWDDYYGWVWVPGTEWGPAWVNWRSDANYYGWAPLGPGVNINISINIPMAHWVFVPRRHIMSQRIYDYCVPRTTVVNVYHNTTIINNYYNYDNRTYVYGPRVQEIEQHSRSRVPVYRVNQDSRPGRAVVDNGSVRIYRPNVTAQRDEAPSRLVTRENFNRPERSSMGNNNYQERSERSSYSESRGNIVREGSTEGNNNAARERFSDIRHNTGNEDYAQRRSSNTSTDRNPATPDYPARPERRSNQTQGGYLGRGSSPESSDYSRTRETTRSRAGTIEREGETAFPAQERTVRERPIRTQVPYERPATTETSVRRETVQPERGQYNGGMRQEEPVSRPVQRLRADDIQHARPETAQPQDEQQRSQFQPQRPQRSQVQPQQQEATDGVPTRRFRN